MTLRTLIVLLTLGTCLPQTLVVATNPAPNRHFQTVFDNAKKVKLDLKLDRGSYFPGESILVSLRASNPGRETVEILDPFDPRAVGIGLYRIDAEGAIVGDAIFLAPGQTIEKQFVLSDMTCSGCMHILPLRVMPTAAGRYRMAYSFLQQFSSRALADFVVEDPLLLEVSTAKIAQPVQVRDSRTGNVQDRHLYLHGAVLESGGRQLVVLSRSPASLGHGWPIGQKLGLRGRRLSPYDRIAESNGPITSLTLELDADQNVIARWTEEGKPTALRLSRDRTIRDRLH